MPEQFDYPDEGMWGTTQLTQKKKSGGKVPSALSEQEWAAYQERTKGSDNFYRNDETFDKLISDRPDGFIVKKNHPELSKYDDQVDTFTVPSSEGNDMSGYLLVKPKAVTS